MLHGWFSLKTGKTYPREVAGIAAVIADQRTRMFLQAVFMRLEATAMIAILLPLVPLLDDVLVRKSLEVEINVVGIDVHCVGIAETEGRVRSQGQVVTSSACLALVVV
jgi:hypothetical protein